MRNKTSLACILIILIGQLFLVKPALAGGWVVITLDALPGPVHAGEMVHLGFVVRQHGLTPINLVSPRLTAVNQDTGETITVDAAQVGETGHFELAVVFPGAGVWEWQIAAPPFPQQVQLEPLSVLPALSIETATSPEPAASGMPQTMRWTGAGLLGLAAMLAFMAEQRRRSVAAPGSAA